MSKFEIFLSYCWSDDEIAGRIETSLAKNDTINLHRDKLDIGTWQSIKEYMHSISIMDYTILLISDAYLKSSNCMYEVLEVMRDRNYDQKIFPVVINSGIYKPAIRAEYVKYWQKEYEDLNNSLQGIKIQNIGRLGDDLKRAQNISANVAEFLDMVSDMNNPAIEDACMAIEGKLKERKFIASVPEENSHKKLSSLEDFIDESAFTKTTKISDYQINQFMQQSFQEINDKMRDLAKQLEDKYPYLQVVVEKNDSRNYLYQFYKEGKLIKRIHIFLNQVFGNMTIRISTNFYSFSNNSWNEEYISQDIDGKLYLASQFSYVSKEYKMSSEDVVKDIWEKYINPYLS